MKKKIGLQRRNKQYKKEKDRTLNRKACQVTMLPSVTQFRVSELRCKGDKMCYRALEFTGDKV